MVDFGEHGIDLRDALGRWLERRCLGLAVAHAGRCVGLARRNNKPPTSTTAAGGSSRLASIECPDRRSERVAPRIERESGRKHHHRTCDIPSVSANDPTDSALVTVRAGGRVLCRGTLTLAR